MLTEQNYNPDVLSCIANLSSDEVFTPPELVNQMLDLLPQSLWTDPQATFLDPACKSGVFLREIAKRLDKGLEKSIPDRQTRIDHIFTKQLFGLAITELTALLARRSVYCSKTANGKYSVCTAFSNAEGNIPFDKVQHTWYKGRCQFCGANEAAYERGEELESHAYAFIHTQNPEELFKMKFDVIIGNPPYQLSDGGHSRSASPIYHKFVEQTIKLNPRFMSMIIPARWYSGGKGLDEFRKNMLDDRRIRRLVDFENSSDVFPGVDVAGGICYFLWDRDNPGTCSVTSCFNEEEYTTDRDLNEFGIFIRHSKAVPIVKKIKEIEKASINLNEVVLPSKPFGIRGHYEPKKSGVPCHFTQKQGLLFVHKDDVDDRFNVVNQFKLLIPRAPIAGQTDFSKPIGFYYEGNVKIAKPGEVCTESWLVAFTADSFEEIVCFKSYLFTKIVRFLLLQTVVSQDVTREKFAFIPHLVSYDVFFDDAILRKRWNITDDEWYFIDSKVKSVEYQDTIEDLIDA
ncbi:MAG: restriction endonuclease [Candidatus Cloacimonetes bacterium]|nr:restriction endonuclease [Candidatus Cloacimonadota bacterium]